VEIHDLWRLLAAALAGALIGVEREWHDKPAGLRTNMLICLGAALFTVLSEHIAARAGMADPGRIAAQIVTGVGFLGAGAIIQSRGQVLGLTTAATIWMVAGVGMAFGAGLYLLGAVATVLAVLVLFALTFAEDAFRHVRSTAGLVIEFGADSDAGVDTVMELLRQHRLRCAHWHTRRAREGEAWHLEVQGVGTAGAIAALEQTLQRHPAVGCVQRRWERNGGELDRGESNLRPPGDTPTE